MKGIVISMEKNLKYFMRDDSKVEQIVKIPAPKRFVDDDGNPIEMEVRVLSSEQVNKINDMYTTKKMAMFNKKPIVNNGTVAYMEERDSARATNHIIVEALKFPNLKDEELMKFFNCHDITEMPNKVFPTFDEYKYVNHMVLVILGLADADENDEANDNKQSANDEEIEVAKNS